MRGSLAYVILLMALAMACTFHVDKPDVHVDKVDVTACFTLGPGGSLIGIGCPTETDAAPVVDASKPDAADAAADVEAE